MYVHFTHTLCRSFDVWTRNLNGFSRSYRSPPGTRYTGGEWGEIKKDLKDVRVRVAFCFPDTYEIGMSNTGMRILYQVLNDLPGVWCERVFAPWGDMEQEMRNANIPLYALESFDPIKDFDIIAFSVGYEMAYTTVLDMLDMSSPPVYLAGFCTRGSMRSSLLSMFSLPKIHDPSAEKPFKQRRKLRHGRDSVVGNDTVPKRLRVLLPGHL